MVEQGTQAGRLFPAVEHEYADPETGARVRRLTDFAAHSNHLYFTNDGWYDDGRKLLFNSDRGGAHNLYSIALETGVITQLTDLPKLDENYTQFGRNAGLDPTAPAVYFWYGERLLALDPEALTLEVLFETPEGFTYSGAHNSVTADGEHVCTSIRETVDASSSAERWEAAPLTKLLRIPVGGGPAEVVHEENAVLSHTNASPTRPELMTFAQEGPWRRTSQRIWGLNADTGETWPIRPEESGEMIGHEFWLADGESVGYHGRYADGEPFYGVTRYDNEERIEEPIPEALFEHEGRRGHFHSHVRERVVSDCTPAFPYLALWRLNEAGDGYERPRKLARHDLSTFEFGRLHVHPRFSPDGSQVLFLSDRSEYANLYLVDVPDADALPPATA